MIYIQHVLFGILMAYFGLISPGMLNMTGLKISINLGRKQAVKFALGASIVVFIQALIALFFADYFVKNPTIINALKSVAVVVFFVLSIFFFLLSRKKVEANVSYNKSKYFLKGIGMSAINMLAIPFYLGISIYLASSKRIFIEHPFIILFVIGASVGSFLLFYTYIFLAKIIIKKVAFIASNINIILSILFFGLGILTLIKLMT